MLGDSFQVAIAIYRNVTDWLVFGVALVCLTFRVMGDRLVKVAVLCCRNYP